MGDVEARVLEKGTFSSVFFLQMWVCKTMVEPIHLHKATNTTGVGVPLCMFRRIMPVYTLCGRPKSWGFVQCG